MHTFDVCKEKKQKNAFHNVKIVTTLLANAAHDVRVHGVTCFHSLAIWLVCEQFLVKRSAQ
jgi:hypothetical protein